MLVLCILQLSLLSRITIFLSLPFAPFLLTSISANNMPLFRTSFISSWLAYEIFSSNIGLFTLELPSLRECLIHSPFIGYDLLYECNQLMWLFYLPCQSSLTNGISMRLPIILYLMQLITLISNYLSLSKDQRRTLLKQKFYL